MQSLDVILLLIFTGLEREVIEAGEKAVVSLYNGKSDETLDCLRYQRYCQKVASSATEFATYFGPSNLSQFTCIRSGPTMKGS